MKITNEKGITLIALAITIIIMIILVGVTVAISINSGLITTTKTAADDTDNARIEDEIKTIIVTTLEGNEIKDEETLTKLRNKIEKIQGVNQVETDITSNNPIIVKSSSNKEWTIDKKGKVQEKNNEPNIIEFTISEITGFENNNPIYSNVKYNAEEGMTWGEWLEKYEPQYYHVSEQDNRIFREIENYNSMFLCWDDKENRQNGQVYTNEIINTNYEYFILTPGEGLFVYFNGDTDAL